MKKLLLIAYYFPPVATSGTFRSLNFCRYLPYYGWTPQVLATTSESIWPRLPEDELLCGRLAATVQIDRVAHGNPFRVLNRAADCIRPMLRLVREASSSGPVLGHTAARNSHQSVINLVELLLVRVLNSPIHSVFGCGRLFGNWMLFVLRIGQMLCWPLANLGRRW